MRDSPMSEIRHPLPDPPKDSDATLIHNDGDVVVSFPAKGVIGYWRHLVFSIVVALVGVPLFFVTMYPATVLLWRVLPVCVSASGLYLLGSTIQRGRTRTRITSGGGDLTVEKV